ncbi:tetratricopeptide repeat-containing diguanylate cyclase [Planococcus sp. FY231025]|uniref:sensor domain-containing diguanylate cyclase n=1 Tax=Planococcus sp. FY231025 TaxID=3455699 RepID=UPI003F90707F
MSEGNLVYFQKQTILNRVEGSNRSAVHAAYQVLEDSLESEDSRRIMAAYLRIGRVFFEAGETEEAFRYINAYKELCAASGDGIDWLHLHHALFELYQFTNDTGKAAETLEAIIALGQRLEKHNVVSDAYIGLSRIFLMEGNHAAALEMAEKGLQEADLHERESAILKLKVKLNKAEAQIGLWNFKGSEKLFEDMESSPALDEFIHEKTRFYELQGAWFAKQKKYEEAFDAYTIAKEMAESLKDLEQLKRIQEERCRLCELIGDSKLGFSVQKEYIALLTEIHNNELAKAAVKMEIQHNIAEYERRANTDFLTGLYNRSYIETTADEWLRKAAAVRENLVCIVFDIDDFKAINDENGHLFGDEAIKLVSRACSQIFREEDLVGRFGGDEFVIILKGASLEIGKHKAEQLTEALAAVPLDKEGEAFELTISIGISDNGAGAVKTFKELFHLADTQLYKAKQSGKNRIIVS